MASGNYGIRLSLTGFDQTKTYLPMLSAIATNTTTREIRTFELSIKDMIGSNFYNTLGYCNQEQVFDIKNFIVTNISLSLFQDGNFKSVNGININNSKIYATNIGVYFGYDLSEFYNVKYKTFLYSTNGLQYNSEYYKKSLYLRFVELMDDKTNLNILNNQLGQGGIFRVHWEQYDPNEIDVAQWSELLAFNTLEGTEIIKEQELSTARNRLKHSYVVTIEDISTGKKYISNTVDFENIAYLEGSQLLDLLTGFQAEFAEEAEGYNGRFFIYGQDSTSTNKIVSSNIHHIILSYNPSSDSDTTSGLQAGDVIQWTIPSENTMIEPVTPIGYDEPQYEVENKILRFSHIIENNDIDIMERKFRIPYKIKDYYSNQLTNNTITFSLIRNENKFNAQKELLFGTSGSQGNEYNMVIKLYKINNNNKEQVNAITLNDISIKYYPQLFIYDYDNKEINLDPNLITWNLSNQNNLIFNNEDQSITINPSFNITTLQNYEPTILIGEWQISTERQDKIKAVYPIAFRMNDNINAISGSTVFTYDITGKKPVYTKTPFKIDGISNQNVNWTIEPEDLDEPWKPILIDNCLIAPSIFHTGSEEQIQYYLTARYKTNNTLLWIQPIYMHQNKYPIGYEQPELNQLSFGDNSMNQKKVKTTLVGKLKNSEDNKISGIIMGILNSNNSDKLGLYAFHDNTEFFCIDEDGYVILNGHTEDNTETGGVSINEAIISNTTINDSVLIDINNIELQNSNTFNINKKNGNNIVNLLSIDNNGNFTVAGNLNFSGTISAEKISGEVTNATNAKNYDTAGNIYSNLLAIQAAIEALDGSYTIV